MQKGSAQIVFLLIALLAIIIGGYFFLNPSKKNFPIAPKVKVESEKTYTNQNLGVEFKYMKGLDTREDSEIEFNKRGNGDFRKNFKGYVGYGPGKFLGAVLVLDKRASYDTNPLTIWVFNNDNNLTIEKWYQNFWYYPFVWGDFTYNGKSKLAPKDEATVSGQPAKSGIVDYQPGKPKFIYLSKDKKMYLFRIIGETGEKILSTVKML